MNNDETKELLLNKVEQKLKPFKQWKDEFGIEWIEVNGKKILKSALVQTCLDIEMQDYMKTNFNFLQY